MILCSITFGFSVRMEHNHKFLGRTYMVSAGAAGSMQKFITNLVGVNLYCGTYSRADII